MNRKDSRGAPLRGITIGALTGSAYWIVEMVLTVVLPWLLTPIHEYEQTDLGLSCLLLVLYLAAGASWGAVVGWLLDQHWRSREAQGSSEPILWAGMQLTLIGLIGWNALTFGEIGWPANLATLPGLLPLALLIVLATRRPEGHLRFVLNPFFVSVVLLFPGWIARRMALLSLSVLGYALLCIAAAAIASWILHTLAQRKTDSRWRWRLATHVTAIVVLLLVNWQARQVVLVTGAESPRVASREDTPNVIFIVLDTVRASNLSVYGYDRSTTPNLERFAETATLFENAIATADYTLPSHASMLTGLYPQTHQVRFDKDHIFGKPLGQEYVTLGEVLLEAGFATAAIVSNNGFLAPHFGLFQGFQFHDYRWPVSWVGRWGITPPQFLRSRLVLESERILPDHVSHHSYRRAEEINETAFEVLDKVAQTDQPVFLFLNYMDAHGYYTPPPPYDALFPGRDPDIRPRAIDQLLYDNYNMGREISDREYRHFISQYDGEIAYLDHQLDRLFRHLKELDLYDNSLIVVTSDHGEAFGGSHNLVGHAISVYQDQVHIPLLIKYPAQSEPAKVENFVSLVDLLPTILGQLEVPVPEGVQGRDLGTLDSSEQRPVFAESVKKVIIFVEGPKPRVQRTQQAVFLGGRKLVVSDPGPIELFDLSQDPDECQNLAEQFPEDTRHLRALLEAWELSSGTVVRGVPQPSKETLDRLRSLGYLK